MSNLAAGSLRYRAMVQRLTSDVGTRGQNAGEWEDLFTAACDYEYLSGRKLELARQLFTRATIQVRMRLPRMYTLTPRDRIIVNSTTLTIGAILPKSDGLDDLEMLCEVAQ
jgi:SPP1 family predicted phage head-tail adaptor